MNFFLQNKPFLVPAAGHKKIEEHFGLSATNTGNLSITHMVAPPGWSEPHQVPQFDEWVLLNSGKKLIEIDGFVMVIEAGQSMLIKKGAIVKYSNPFNEACAYWSICLPAFLPEHPNSEGLA